MTTETGPDSEVKNAQEEAAAQQLEAAASGPHTVTSGSVPPASHQEADANEKPGGAHSDSKHAERVSRDWLLRAPCLRKKLTVWRARTRSLPT